MRITVELFGTSRDLAGGTDVLLELAEPATARQALELLASRLPALVGPVLGPDPGAPNRHHLVSLDGRRFLSDLAEPLPDGSHLLLIATAAGGRCRSQGSSPHRR